MKKRIKEPRKRPDKNLLNSSYTIQEVLKVRETKRTALYHGEARS